MAPKANRLRPVNVTPTATARRAATCFSLTHLTCETSMTLATSIILSLAALTAEQAAKTADHPIVLTVQVKSRKPVTFTANELDRFDRTKVKVQAGRDEQTYEGVCLATVLHAAGAPWGSKSSLWLDCYVVVEAADGYRVVFSVPEIDPGSAHKTVLLADRRNGKPLSKTEGPYQVIEEDARHRGRWVRQVTAIRLRVASD